MDQSILVCGVTRIAFDLKWEALETTLMDHLYAEILTHLFYISCTVVIDIHCNREVPCGVLIIWTNLSWNYRECPMITAHVYIWPERGDVDYFLSKLAPKGQIADCIRIREATADTAMMKMEWFVIFVDLSTFCPNIFCKIIKFKIINC